MTYRYTELYDPYQGAHVWGCVKAGDTVSIPQDNYHDKFFIIEARLKASELKCAVKFEIKKGFFGHYVYAYFIGTLASAATNSVVPNGVNY